MILTAQLGTERKAIYYINYRYARALRVEKFRYKRKFHWIYSAIFATPLSGSVSVFLFPCPNEFGRLCIRQADRRKRNMVQAD